VNSPVNEVIALIRAPLKGPSRAARAQDTLKATSCGPIRNQASAPGGAHSRRGSAEHVKRATVRPSALGRSQRALKHYPEERSARLFLAAALGAPARRGPSGRRWSAVDAHAWENDDLAERTVHGLAIRAAASARHGGTGWSPISLSTAARAIIAHSNERSCICFLSADLIKTQLS
jgi:hypothetical protein